MACALAVITVVVFAGVAEAAPPCDRIVFSTGPQTIVAGGASTAITIEARRSGSNRCGIRGGSLAVALSVDPAGGLFSSDAAGAFPTTLTTLSSATPHRAMFYYRDTVPGARVITATHASLGSASQKEMVTAAGLDHFLLAAPATAEPGVPFSVTVTAQDGFGNTITGYLGTVHFSTNDGLGVVPADYTYTGVDAGTRAFVGGVTLSTTGSMSIQVADGSTVTSATVSVTIHNIVDGTAGGTASLTIIPGARTCTSPALTDADHLCQYDLRGTYADGAYLGNGTIAGRLYVDDRLYGPDPRYGENCYSSVQGIVKFTNAQGTLRTKIDDTTSVLCAGANGSKDIHLVLLGQPGGNVGSYTNTTGGRVTWSGTWTPIDATTFTDADTFSGVIETT